MHEVLRSVWAEPAPPHPPARVWRDWALLGALVPLAVIEGVFRAGLQWRALSVVIVVAVLPTLLWRRTRPLPMLAIAFGVTALAPLAMGGTELENNAVAFVLILVYALVRWGSGRAIVLGLAIVFAKIGGAAAVGQISPGDMFAGFVVVSAAITPGLALRYRAAARLRELERVKLLERERLARDLHDTVAHHVSAMAIRAQAGLATAASHPDAATDALRVIEAEASRALAEMRGMVRILRRDEPAELTPGPRIADLEKLAGRHRSGPSVDVGIAGDLDDVSPAVGSAIFRLAQESVTNARRHARHATRIQVRVSADPDSVRLQVSDDGEAGGGAPAGTGYGLIGMAERAGLLGGTCEAGPAAGRGWTVTAVLPRAGGAT
ncbi:sensor histidine kinase [Amorphoplanes digitatis]|uniref:histidine kinase n=1 Tax=Actinoplanes digitatis TaxID=1868 RepID=A0A7W7HU66_9ACTN|nr:histidine kinase [Actinoplanes digitatis]MBB4760842.1 signal transduction histidine kinase [Actinoplanes digitatis]